MKITTVTKGIYVALVLFIGLAACKKETDLILSNDQLPIGSYLQLVSRGNDTLFLNNTSRPVSITVKTVGQQATKVTVYASTNNSVNRSTWRKVAEFPVDQSQQVTLSVTPAQIATALGAPIANGAEVVLFNEITTSTGQTFSMANTAGDFESAADYRMAMRWSARAPCSWDQSVFTGNFTVIRDTWADFNPGEQVQVRTGPAANQIQILAFPSPAYGTNRQWYTLTVNTTTLDVTGTAQVIGDYFPFSAGGQPYPNTTMTVTAGRVNPCSREIDLTNIGFNYFGAGYRLTLRRL